VPICNVNPLFMTPFAAGRQSLVGIVRPAAETRLCPAVTPAALRNRRADPDARQRRSAQMGLPAAFAFTLCFRCQGSESGDGTGPARSVPAIEATSSCFSIAKQKGTEGRYVYLVSVPHVRLAYKSWRVYTTLVQCNRNCWLLVKSKFPHCTRTHPSPRRMKARTVVG
jgi:hypothetical protein